LLRTCRQRPWFVLVIICVPFQYQYVSGLLTLSICLHPQNIMMRPAACLFSTHLPNRHHQDGTILTELGPYDVLVGRGTGPNETQGNVRFRALVKAMTAKQQGCMSRNQQQQVRGEPAVTKLDMARKVVESIRSLGGNFVRKLTKDEMRIVAPPTAKRSSSKKKLSMRQSTPDPRNSTSKSEKRSPNYYYVVVTGAVAIAKTKQSIRFQVNSKTGEDQKGQGRVRKTTGSDITAALLKDSDVAADAARARGYTATRLRCHAIDKQTKCLSSRIIDSQLGCLSSLKKSHDDLSVLAGGDAYNHSLLVMPKVLAVGALRNLQPAQAPLAGVPPPYNDATAASLTKYASILLNRPPAVLRGGPSSSGQEIMGCLESCLVPRLLNVRVDHGSTSWQHHPLVRRGALLPTYSRSLAAPADHLALLMGRPGGIDPCPIMPY
jgi:hypothetical protein